jgi:poly-gamma-glutamate synthesis protein (capsule biosynthesis protein)
VKFLVDAQLPARLGRFLADAAAPPNPDTALRLQSPGAVITPGRPLDTTEPSRAWLPAGGSRCSQYRGLDRLRRGPALDRLVRRHGHRSATSGAHAWSLSSTATITPTAACAGSGVGVGVELSRSPVSALDVIATPEHRQLVNRGDVLPLVDVRDASPGSTVELSWYPDTRVASTATTSAPIPAGSHPSSSCRRVRIDATVPDGIIAVQPVVRLAPPLDVHRGARLAVDNVQLISWAPPGESGPRFDTIESRDDAVLTLIAATGADDAPSPVQ